MEITRRNFFQLVSYSSAGLIGVPWLATGCSSTKEDNLSDSLYSQFFNPPNTAKPFVRWWWNGDRLREEEILRELDLLKEAGIGGVEINPIKFPGGDTLGIEPLTWLSDEWIEMLKVAVKGAHERHLVCDIIVGSGWPFGGEFLEKEEQTQILALGTLDLKNLRSFKVTKQELLDEVKLEIHSKHEPFFKELHSVRLVSSKMEEFNQGKDLSNQFQGDTLTIDLNDGEYILYFTVLATGFQAVINGAPGAAGPVLNHYNKSAVQKYLNRMSDALNPKLNGMDSAFRAMFCDSLELEGANWCNDMLEEFEKRRGYSLQPYLPFVLFKIGRMGNRVAEAYGTEFKGTALDEIKRARYDFYITRQEIFKERFIDTYQHWCESNNVKSRIQAYGRGYHPIEASMFIDIPEGETWFNPISGGKTLINKFVSSGSRLAGKKLVSCEEITNTGWVFFATLEMIKVTGDQSNLSGVNHSILHGFNYSPLEAEFPGWVRYGTFFNERNPWWPYFKSWTAYKARISYLFQNATARADIAIMHPLTEIWMELGLQRLPFPIDEYPWYQHKLWKAIHQNGNTCDYIMEKILIEGKIENGSLIYNGRSYSTIMLMEVESIQAKSAEALARFAESGGKIIFIGKVPHKSPGLMNYHEEGLVVNETIQRIIDEYPVNCALVQAPGKDLINWFKEIQQKFSINPPVFIDHPDSAISQVQYTYEDKEIFFFVNSNPEKKYTIQARFNTGNKIPWLWDLETGKRFIYPFEKNRNQLTIEFEPAGSKIIVFDSESKGELAPMIQFDYSTAVLIDGPWELDLQHVDGSQKNFSLDKLLDFKEDSELKTFAGTAIYSKTITVVSEEDYTHLDLGEVHGISEISINDNLLGFKWYGDHIYELDNVLKVGENTIEIKVTTVLGNYCKSLKNNEIAQRWTINQPYHSVGIRGPVQLLKSI